MVGIVMGAIAVCIPATASEQDFVVGGRKVRVLASGELEVSWSKQMVVARGGVEATWEEAWVGCDSLTIDLEKHTLLAEGNVSLRWQDTVLQCERVELDMERGSGSMEAPRGQTDGLYFRADSLARDVAGNTILKQARLTFCDREPPHSALVVSEAVIDSTGRLEAKGGYLWLYGHRRVSFPRYHTRLKRPEHTVPVPLPGYSRGYGPYLGWALDYAPLNLWLRATARRGLAAKAALASEKGNWNWSITASRSEDLPDLLVSNVFVSREPEVQLTYNFPLRPEAWQLSLTSAWGHSDEIPSKASSDRRSLGATLTSPELRLGEAVARVDVRGWRNDYGGGQSYRALRTGLEVESGGKAGQHLRFAYYHHDITGSSPFRYDVVYVPEEGRGDVSFLLGKQWALGLVGRYDFGAGKWADSRVRLTSLQHELAYSVEWSERRKAVVVGVGLNALVVPRAKAGTH